MKIPDITQNAQKALGFLYKHRIIIFIVGFVGCYGFLITRISTYTQREPGVETSEQAIQRLTIDAESIEKIQDLEDQNVEVRALFEEARKNPFSE